MLISLCLIAGNVEEYIARCLESFAPIADEICLVRAIGNQEPDRTIEIAKDLYFTRPSYFESPSERMGTPLKWAEYKNKPGHEDWPHIDDFAAARQQSFDMASGKYIFWCDTDDLLQSGADIVRELAAANDYDCFIFPYEIFGRHVSVPRERMVKAHLGKWENPVHEYFKFPETVDGYRDDRVVVRHIPHLQKKGSSERNLRIISGIDEETLEPGMLFHLHSELLAANRKLEAIEAAKKALAHPELGSPERYELCIHLATMSEDPRLIETYLMAAYQADPCRREALGLLSGHMIDTGEPQKAIAFARQMISTLVPENENWNDRRAAYGWLGYEIFQQALRANNLYEDAEQIRTELLKRAGGAKISLIHATRGRPKQAATARKLWYDLAENPEQIEHIFVFNDDDEASAPLARMHHIRIAEEGCVAAWNAGAWHSSGKVFIQMSDDWVPPPRWDTLILERLSGNEQSDMSRSGLVIGDERGQAPSPAQISPLDKPKVLAVSDGHRKDQLLCMAIGTRAYFTLDWFMFHPDFNGVYSDNWFTHEAYRRDHEGTAELVDATDLVFEHDHPAFNKLKEVDATYQEQNAPERYAEGKQIYERLIAGKDWSSVPGWFNFWPFYREIAKTLKDGDVVAEIGVWLGRSIIFLAQECQQLGKNVRFIAVDTFQGEKDQPAHYDLVQQSGGNIRKLFEANIVRCGVDHLIQIIEGDSAEAATQVSDNSLAFCFIDAAHDYESVKRDIEAWIPKVNYKEGRLAGHDFQWPEVRRAVQELLPNAKVAAPVSVWTT